MDTVLRYRGRAISSADVAAIAKHIVDHPEASRRALSIKVCEAWSWRQPNGALCDGLCRGLLLALHRAGHITLPAPRGKAVPRWRTPPAVAVLAAPLEARLNELCSVEIRQVRRTGGEALVDSLIAQHHYLGYARPVGAVPFCYTSLTH